MPLLVNQVGKEVEADASSDGDTGRAAMKRVKEAEGALLAIHNDRFEKLPCPTIVGSGAAGRVLPVGWCHPS